MTNDDLLFRHRLRLFARAAEVGVSRACRELGYHRSWYYRWKPVVEQQGLELPGQLQASSGDVPLMLYTAPQLEQSVFGTSLGSIGEDSVVIEAYVDANGRVQDYRILSQSDDAKAVLPQVKNLLIFTTFRPALSMGRPIAGRAVISFSKISVRG